SVGAYQHLVSAADSSVQYGTGLAALTVTSTTKQIKDIVPGLTLDLVSASATPVTVTIANDGQPALDGIKKVITDLNDVIDFWKTNGGYDANTKKPGPLANESALRSGVNAVISSFTGTVSGLPRGLSALTAVGVSVDKVTGKLSLDEAVFKAKMASDPDGVGRLFSTSGSSTAPSIQFVSMGEKTASNTAFSVNVTQAATQATLTGYAALGASTVINSTNNRLRMTINGTIYDITIASNTYSRSAMVAHLQSSIDTLAGANQVTVALDGSDQLVFTTKAYGSAFSLTTTDVGASDARAALSLAATTVSGVNVAGTINGVAATGLGQALTANAGSSAEGLRLLITGAAGTTGSVTGIRGLGQITYNRILALTKASTGSVPQKEDTYTKLISGLDVQIKRNDAKLATRRAYYEAQFLAMESIISKTKSQSDALMQGLAAFQNSSTNSNSNRSN
ncbi:MAG: flagellar filament capping protein FliD, partial [Planctomycetota bacterium]